MTEDRREELLAAGKGIAFETVFSSPGKVEVIERAKARGYFVRVFFISTSDPRINAARVAGRVMLTELERRVVADSASGWNETRTSGRVRARQEYRAALVRRPRASGAGDDLTRTSNSLRRNRPKRRQARDPFDATVLFEKIHGHARLERLERLLPPGKRVDKNDVTQSIERRMDGLRARKRTPGNAYLAGVGSGLSALPLVGSAPM